MNIKLTFIIFLCFIFSLAKAQNESFESIKETDLRAHLEFMSSDLLQGRDFGTPIPGLDIAAEYLKSQCLRIGLNPVNAGKYVQITELEKIKTIEDSTYIQIENSKEKPFVSYDSIADYYGSAVDDIFSGGVGFIGYANINDKTGYNDLKGVNLKNRYVLVITRNREMVMNNEPIDVTKELQKHSLLFEKGARGIIKVIDPLYHDRQLFESVKNFKKAGQIVLNGNNSNKKTGQVIFVTESVANKILQESGKTLKELQEEINETGKSNSFETNSTKVEIHVTKSRVPVTGKNIIGIIEGSDPELKNEYIILTAHYDHLGVSADGEVYNGADDNGSGTVALLEIADAISQMKEKPKRSIVFAWFTAEEWGLLGSEYYSLNPIVPLKNTIACINFDMVGRSAKDSLIIHEDRTNKPLAGENGVYIVSGRQSSELMKLSFEICDEMGLLPSDEMTKTILDRSDYYNFYKNGIPIIGVTTGIHEEYHQPSDDIDKIDFNKLKRISQFGFLLTTAIAKKNERFVVDKPYSDSK